MRTDRVQVIAGSLWLSMQIEKDRKEALCIDRWQPTGTESAPRWLVITLNLVADQVHWIEVSGRFLSLFTSVEAPAIIHFDFPSRCSGYLLHPITTPPFGPHQGLR